MIPPRTPHAHAPLLSIAALLLLAPALSAQAEPVRVERDADCQSWSGDRESYCEVREYVLEPHARLTVDAGQNGGIDVTGWDRDEVRLVARLQGHDRAGDPERLVREVVIRTGPIIEAAGPRAGRGASWSASFELMVPRETGLRLRASNGGIALSRLSGDIDATTTNGGIHLVGGAGRVRGETTNGGLRLELTGTTWDGAGVDLRTTNGGVRVTVPDGYSADLETGTVNGAIQLDIPVMVQGRIDRRIRTELGGGGPLIRATTTNGGVVISR